MGGYFTYLCQELDVIARVQAAEPITTATPGGSTTLRHRRRAKRPKILQDTEYQPFRTCEPLATFHIRRPLRLMALPVELLGRILNHAYENSQEGRFHKVRYVKYDSPSAIWFVSMKLFLPKKFAQIFVSKTFAKLAVPHIARNHVLKIEYLRVQEYTEIVEKDNIYAYGIATGILQPYFMQILTFAHYVSIAGEIEWPQAARNLRLICQDCHYLKVLRHDLPACQWITRYIYNSDQQQGDYQRNFPRPLNSPRQKGDRVEEVWDHELEQIMRKNKWPIRLKTMVRDLYMWEPYADIFADLKVVFTELKRSSPKCEFWVRLNLYCDRYAQCERTGKFTKARFMLPITKEFRAGGLIGRSIML